MLARFTITVALSACAIPTLAAWEPLASTKLGDKTVDVFIDQARIRDQDGHKMVWQLDNIRDDVPPEQARSAVRLFAVDCARVSTALADLVLYKGAMGKGESLGRQPSRALEFEPALPDSVAEQLVYRACVPPEQQQSLREGTTRNGVPSSPGPSSPQSAGSPGLPTQPPQAAGR